MSNTLLTVEQAFYSGDYNAVISADGNNDERIRSLQVRSLVQTGDRAKALSLAQSSSTPLSQALKAYVEQNEEDAVKTLNTEPKNDEIRHLTALTQAVNKNIKDAFETLKLSGQHLDSYFLKVHLLLQVQRNEEALKTVDEMRKFANDHIIFNVCEALTSLRSQQTAQKAYFIYEENNSVNKTPVNSLGEAVANIEMSRFPEASEAMSLAVQDNSLPSLISALSLAILQGDQKAAEEFRGKLKLAKYQDSDYQAQLKEKEADFDRIIKMFA